MKILRAFTSLILVALAVGVANAQIPSERTRMGLNGPVRIIRREYQEYRWENSQWDPIGDPIRDLVRYDRRGRCLTPHINPGSGWRAYGVPLPPATATRSRRYEIVRKLSSDMSWKTVWQFDTEGRLGRFEEYAKYQDGWVPSNWHHYSYDSRGRVRELTYWGDWGWSPGQTEPYPPVRVKYWLDDAGRIGGWADSNDPKSRSTLTYDRKGRLLKEVEEKADGNITYVTTQTWDGYDQHGNWTVHTMTVAWRTEDGEEPHTKSMFRRSITYRSNKPGPIN